MQYCVPGITLGEKYEKDYFSHIGGALDGIYF